MHSTATDTILAGPHNADAHSDPHIGYHKLHGPPRAVHASSGAVPLGVELSESAAAKDSLHQSSVRRPELHDSKDAPIRDEAGAEILAARIWTEADDSVM